MVPWKLTARHRDGTQKQEEFQRYCHVFKAGELTELFHKCPGAVVEKEWFERSNWCVLVRRVL